MKKNILFTSALLIVFSFLAFRMIHNDPFEVDLNPKPEVKTSSISFGLPFLKSEGSGLKLSYDVDTRYIYKVTKDKLHKSKGLQDLFPPEKTGEIKSFKNIRIANLSNELEILKEGEDGLFSEDQSDLLQSFDYSADFRISSIYYRKFGTGDHAVRDSFVYYVTVIPEKQAKYLNGKEILLEYFRMNTTEIAEIVNEDKLEPGKMRFTITKNGEIDHVYLSTSSGFSEYDDTVKELITSMPGTWSPAVNVNGEKVDQELVVSFGLIGC